MHDLYQWNIYQSFIKTDVFSVVWLKKKFFLGSPIDSKNKKTPFNMFFSMYVIGCLLKWQKMSFFPTL